MDEMRQRARDPRTSWEELRYLAEHRPDLRADIAANPNTYPDLRAWLASLGDPEINRVLRGDPLTGNLPRVAIEEPEPERTKRPYFIGAAVLAGLAVTGGLAYAALSGGQDPVATDPTTAVVEETDLTTEPSPTEESTDLEIVGPGLDDPLPSGERLDMETDYSGPITSTPFDSAYSNGIVPGHVFEGRFIGISTNAQITVTSTGNEIIGWDVVTGEEQWRTEASVDLEWDPYVAQSADNNIIWSNHSINMMTGEITTLNVPESALFCGGYSDLTVFAEGTDLIGFKGDGSEAWRVANVLGGYEVGTCGFHDTYVRVHPTARQVDPVTISASTGSTMTLPGLEDWYSTSYLLPNGVVMSATNIPAGRTAPIPDGNWAAWDLSSGDLLATAPFHGEPGYLPRLYSTPNSDINLYAEAINRGWDEGYLIARNGKILAHTDVHGDLVSTIIGTNGPSFDLPTPIVNKSAKHTLTVLNDDDTLIVSPARSREGDAMYDGFVAAYSLSTGDELWSYTVGPTEQVYVTSGYLWVVDSERLTTIFYTPAQ